MKKKTNHARKPSTMVHDHMLVHNLNPPNSIHDSDLNIFANLYTTDSNQRGSPLKGNMSRINLIQASQSNQCFIHMYNHHFMV